MTIAHVGSGHQRRSGLCCLCHIPSSTASKRVWVRSVVFSSYRSVSPLRIMGAVLLKHSRQAPATPRGHGAAPGKEWRGEHDSLRSMEQHLDRLWPSQKAHIMPDRGG